MIKTSNLKRGFIPLTIFLLTLILLSFSVGATITYIGITDDTIANVWWSGQSFVVVEWMYNKNITGSPTDFYMAFQDNYQGTEPLNTFVLYINGIDCGNPSSFESVMPNCSLDSLGAMHWGSGALSGVTFDDEEILFEVVHDYGYNYGWYPKNYTDVDGDGDINHRYSNLAYYADGTYSGGLNTLYEILYLMEYNTSILYEVNDSLSVIPSDIEQNAGVTIRYTIDSLGFQNYVNISYLGAVQESYEVNKKTGWFVYYNTSNIGTYTVNLSRNGDTKKTDTFDVTASTRAWYIKFDPNPVNTGSIVTCEVMFNFTEYDGTLFNTATEQEFFCPRNNITTFTFYSGTSAIKPFELWGTLNGTKIDYIGTEYLHVGMLSLDYSIDLSQHVIYATHYVPIDITGSHNLLGTDIRIDVAINNIVIYSIPVGHSGVINERFFYSPRTTIGALTFKLIFNDIVLTYDTCLVKAMPEADEGIGGLPTEYMNAMFGTFLTLGFLIIPFALATKSRHETSSVIYAIFGGLGLGVSTLAGFFPLWLPLMITLLVVTILVIEYKRGH